MKRPAAAVLPHVSLHMLDIEQALTGFLSALEGMTDDDWLVVLERRQADGERIGLAQGVIGTALVATAPGRSTLPADLRTSRNRILQRAYQREATLLATLPLDAACGRRKVPLRAPAEKAIDDVVRALFTYDLLLGMQAGAAAARVVFAPFGGRAPHP